jgi:glycosyltransferase involved in cell wall biosynthesis
VTGRAPKVTIAIPFHDNARTLRDAIVSVLNQSFADWELILVDDGSTDGSRAVAEEFRGDRILVRSDGENRGLVARLNEIVSLASGAYLARMDGDDVMHPHRIERQVAVLDERPEVDVVDTAMYSIDDDGRIRGERGRSESGKITLEALLQGRVLNHATVMGRVEWFLAHPYDPAFYRAEDRELWCRTVETSVFAHIEEPLYYVREGQISVRNYRAAQATVRRIYAIYARRALGGRRALALVAKSLAKEWAYVLAGWLGLQAGLTGLRNVGVGPEHADEAESMLRRATRLPDGRAVDLPGLP